MLKKAKYFVDLKQANQAQLLEAGVPVNQIEISKFYERLPKPTSLAIDEFMEDKFTFALPKNEGSEE